MTAPTTDKYSAGEQGLGYIYQARLALLHLLQLSEDTAVFLEKDDDLDFIDGDGGKSLASLKHKAVGDRLTDLSTDFWKSVNIWLARYKRDGRAASNLRFFLFTTGEVSTASFLARLLPEKPVASGDVATLTELANAALAESMSQLIARIAAAFNELSDPEKQDFLERILILDGSPRIGDIPLIIRDKHMRSIRREHREFVFERLEGWWNDAVIKQLTGARPEGIFGYEVSDKLSNFAEEYKTDNLPITFRGKPADEIDTEADPRLFVAQLREIGISSSRIRSAVLDYYRAFEQRSAWARENLLVSGEVEEYEDRLADEWNRYKDVAFEELKDDSAEDALREAGATLYNWAEFETAKIESLRIRARVTEPYVLRGSFHILADATPEPRVYWHPKFLDRLGKVLGWPREAMEPAPLRDSEPVQPRLLRTGPVPRPPWIPGTRRPWHALLFVAAGAPLVPAQGFARCDRPQSPQLPAQDHGEEPAGHGGLRRPGYADAALCLRGVRPADGKGLHCRRGRWSHPDHTRQGAQDRRWNRRDRLLPEGVAHRRKGIRTHR